MKNNKHVESFGQFNENLNISDVRSGRKINESISFEDLMNRDWQKTIPHDSDGAGVKVDDGVIFTIPEIWDEYKPVSHSMSKEDITKMYNVLFYSKDMFNLLKEIDDDRARDLINRILNDRDKPELR